MPCPCTYRNPTIEHWVPILVRDFRLDLPALTKLRELAAMQRAGYMHANTIIGKCLKKINDARVNFPNPSAFVMSACKNAVSTIERKGS